MEPQAAGRLLCAIALSAVLHVTLIYGMQLGARRPSSQPLKVHLQRLEVTRAAEPPPPIAVPARKMMRGAVVALPAPATVAVDPAPAAAAQTREDTRRPEIDVPTIVDPTWYEARDLDLFPHPLAPVVPEYTATAKEEGVSGELTLTLKVDEYGFVQEATVVKAEPAGYFETAALSAFRSARFAPARRDGRAVRSLIAVRVRMGPAPTPGPEQEALR
jgi:protein TonB